MQNFHGRFLRFAEFYFRGSLAFLYSKQLKKLGFLKFADDYFRGFFFNRENRENYPPRKKPSVQYTHSTLEQGEQPHYIELVVSFPNRFP